MAIDVLKGIESNKWHNSQLHSNKEAHVLKFKWEDPRLIKSFGLECT